MKKTCLPVWNVNSEEPLEILLIPKMESKLLGPAFYKLLGWRKFSYLSTLFGQDLSTRGHLSLLCENLTDFLKDTLGSASERVHEDQMRFVWMFFSDSVCEQYAIF